MILQSLDVTRFISVCLQTMVTIGHNKIDAKNDKRTEIRKVFLSFLYSKYTVQISPQNIRQLLLGDFFTEQNIINEKYLHLWTSLQEVYKLNIFE